MEKFKIKIDKKYGSLTVSSTRDDADKWPKPTYKMNVSFFECNCKQNDDGTRSLILEGDKLQLEIGRRFKNWDVPYLVLFLVNNTNVVKLNLANNEIDSAGFMGLIGHIIVYNYVRELDLRNNKIQEYGINCMYRNRHKLQLQVLRLSGNKLGTQNLKKVALALGNNRHIQQLEVAATDLNEDSFIYFAAILRPELKFANNLRILDLSRPIPKCNYLKFDSQHVAETIGIALRFNATLEEIRLQKFSFSCHDIQDMLVNANHNRTLKVLDLRCNNIGDLGAEVLSKWLKNCSPLQSLLLGRNIISNHGIRALSGAVPFSKLTRLDVSYNSFDDHGCVELLNIILKVPLIKQLQIYGNDIGSSTAQVVEKLFQSNIFEQGSIDVKLYTVDGTTYLAHHELNE